MNSRQTLYEMLGVAQDASLAELQSAYRREAGVLESERANTSPEQFAEKTQLLRLAFNTLTDPVSRLGYDTKLAPGGRKAQGLVATRALAPVGGDAVAASAEVRADALALRADALALRADAMLVRADLDVGAAGRGSMAQAVASGTVTALRRLATALGLLVLIGIGAFVVTRVVVGDPSARRAAVEAKAREQTALQEYYQTYGIRPANMAELELLEADRRRTENQNTHKERDREKEEQDARRFEEESRRRGQEVSEDLRRAEEQAHREAEWERERQAREAQVKQQAEQERIEREKEQWHEVLRR